MVGNVGESLILTTANSSISSVFANSNKSYSNWTYKILVGGGLIGLISTIAAFILAQYATACWAGALTLTSSIGAYYYRPIESLQDDLVLIDQTEQKIKADDKTAQAINRELSDKINQLQKLIDQNNLKLEQAQKALEASQQLIEKDQQQLSSYKPLVDQLAQMARDLEEHEQSFSVYSDALGASVSKLMTAGADLKAENEEIAKAIAIIKQDAPDQTKAMGMLLESLAKKIDNMQKLNLALQQDRKDIIASLASSGSLESDAKEATARLENVSKNLLAASQELAKKQAAKKPGAKKA